MPTAISPASSIRVHSATHHLREFRADVLAGLAMSPKELPCKYFYDRRGSQLFDTICELPEYYLTRTELAITRKYAPDIANHVGQRTAFVELGSGSSVKTRIILDHLQSPAAYIPVDISQDHLLQTAATLETDYPRLRICPVCADFTDDLQLTSLEDYGESSRTIYFPGSTIGNFQSGEAQRLLKRIGTLAGSGGGLLVGIDLQKDVSVIEAAYNDAQGVTAQFNRNLLRRINRELGAKFDLDAFRHRAYYDSQHGRVVIQLISERRQEVRIGDRRFTFEIGEPILTEYSHKYTIPAFAALATEAGFALKCAWSDENDYFALLYLVRTTPDRGATYSQGQSMSALEVETTIRDEPALVDRYRRVRQFTETLCETLEPEDCCIQSMPDASPTRWHLAHTTWFFDTFVLDGQADRSTHASSYQYLFNSYYNAVGAQFPRSQRGLLSRPTVGQVLSYRREIDERITELCAANDPLPEELTYKLELGINHEQQHQELMLTDIKHAFSCNPLLPTYRPGAFDLGKAPSDDGWIEFDGGIHSIGHSGNGFAYDNESPRHRVLLEPFQLQNRLVTVGDFLAFVQDGGYSRPELWLSEGWRHVVEQKWQAPLYWLERDGQWHEFTLAGLQGVEASRPVCHVSYFEADAFARWADARLPTEAEWEVASRGASETGNFADLLIADDAAVHPSAAENAAHPAQMFGDVWEWTASPYVAYPGYTTAVGALGEYNGKFMCNQFVLRGGSCATPFGHVRRTYRNFFPAAARWQFSGLRLAK